MLPQLTTNYAFFFPAKTSYVSLVPAAFLPPCLLSSEKADEAMAVRDQKDVGEPAEPRGPDREALLPNGTTDATDHLEASRVSVGAWPSLSEVLQARFSSPLRTTAGCLRALQFVLHDAALGDMPSIAHDYLTGRS